MVYIFYLVVYLFSCGFTYNVHANFDDPVKTSLISEVKSVQPGHSFWVMVHFQVEPSWHGYWKNPENSDMVPSIQWDLPAGYEIESLLWPAPKSINTTSSQTGIIAFGDGEEFFFLAKIAPPKNLQDKTLAIKALAKWLTCSDSMCLPGRDNLVLSLPIEASKPAIAPEHAELFKRARALLSQTDADFEVSMIEPKSKKINDTSLSASPAPEQIDPFAEFRGSLSVAWLFAFMGGLLLNLMPCVLPVISFKIMGFIKLAGENRKLIFRHGLAFSFGVLISFWVLAAILLGLQAYGRSVGWGFQLQEPIFVAILAAFLFLFALSLFGLFEFGVSLMSAAGQAEQTKHRNLYVGSFLSGVLATAVATPCTGPFLGSAVGYAVTLPSLQALSIFTFLGMGMSSPYLIIAAFPSLLRFLPKPGAWMIAFKELMGFFMLASVIWLLWVFGAQTDNMAMSLLLASFFCLALSAWIYGRFATPVQTKIKRIASTITAMAIFVCGCYLLLFSSTMATGEKTITDHHEIASSWEQFSPERVAELRAKNIPVFIDFTAKWCLICQANHAVLSTEEVSAKFTDAGVVKMKADWTRQDSVIAEELRKHGRNSVPLYILYEGNGDASPKILPQLLTKDTVIDSLNALD